MNSKEFYKRIEEIESDINTLMLSYKNTHLHEHIENAFGCLLQTDRAGAADLIRISDNLGDDNFDEIAQKDFAERMLKRNALVEKFKLLMLPFDLRLNTLSIAIRSQVKSAIEKVLKVDEMEEWHSCCPNCYQQNISTTRVEHFYNYFAQVFLPSDTELADKYDYILELKSVCNSCGTKWNNFFDELDKYLDQQLIMP